MKKLITYFVITSFFCISTLPADVTTLEPTQNANSQNEITQQALPPRETPEQQAELQNEADSSNDAATTTIQQADTMDPLTEAKYVGKASEDSTKAASKERWQNFALAAGAVTVATVALILVSNNKGKKDHSSN